MHTRRGNVNNHGGTATRRRNLKSIVSGKAIESKHFVFARTEAKRLFSIRCAGQNTARNSALAPCRRASVVINDPLLVVFLQHHTIGIVFIIEKINVVARVQ